MISKGDKTTHFGALKLKAEVLAKYLEEPLGKVIFIIIIIIMLLLLVCYNIFCFKLFFFFTFSNCMFRFCQLKMF